MLQLTVRGARTTIVKRVNLNRRARRRCAGECAYRHQVQLTTKMPENLCLKTST